MGFFSPAIREALEINRTIKKAGSAQDVMFFLILTSWLRIYPKSLFGSTLKFFGFIAAPFVTVWEIYGDVFREVLPAVAREKQATFFNK
jgi:hypothetical protein